MSRDYDLQADWQWVVLSRPVDGFIQRAARATDKADKGVDAVNPLPFFARSGFNKSADHWVPHHHCGARSGFDSYARSSLWCSLRLVSRTRVRQLSARPPNNLSWNSQSYE